MRARRRGCRRGIILLSRRRRWGLCSREGVVFLSRLLRVRWRLRLRSRPRSSSSRVIGPQLRECRRTLSRRVMVILRKRLLALSSSLIKRLRRISRMGVLRRRRLSPLRRRRIRGSRLVRILGSRADEVYAALHGARGDHGLNAAGRAVGRPSELAGGLIP